MWTGGIWRTPRPAAVVMTGKRRIALPDTAATKQQFGVQRPNGGYGSSSGGRGRSRSVMPGAAGIGILPGAASRYGEYLRLKAPAHPAITIAPDPGSGRSVRFRSGVQRILMRTLGRRQRDVREQQGRGRGRRAAFVMARIPTGAPAPGAIGHPDCTRSGHGWATQWSASCCCSGWDNFKGGETNDGPRCGQWTPPAGLEERDDGR